MTRVIVTRFRLTFAALILVQAAHSVEEYMGRLWDSFPPARLLTGLISPDREWSFVTLNVLLIAFGLWCLLWPVRREWPSAVYLGWAWVIVEAINGIVHPLWTLREGGYTPGVATAPLLLVLAVCLGYQLRKGAAVKQVARILALILALGISVGATETGTAHAEQSGDPRVADLVRTGKLRVGIGLGSPSGAMKNQATGELRGLAVDLGRALATRIGVEFVAVEYPRPGAILEGVQTNAWDVAFLVVDPERAREVDFAAPHTQSDFTYLVPADSPIRKVADADQSGIRIAVPRGDAVDLSLMRVLKKAELVRTDTISAAVELVRTGGAHARAGPRQALLAESGKLPGFRVLEDGFAVISSAAGVPKGHRERVAYISEFIEEAKASGSIKSMIEHAGLRGIQVAPAAKAERPIAAPTPGESSSSRQ